MDDKELRAKLRTALADYMLSEGCSCCQGSQHHDHANVLGKLLNVKRYDDGSGYDFYRYATKERS